MGELRYSDSVGSDNARLRNNRRNGFLSSYFGIVPIVGGAFGSIAAASFAGAVYTVSALMNQPQNILQFPEVYRAASQIAGEFLLPGFLVGQGFTYVAKERIGRLLFGRKKD